MSTGPTSLSPYLLAVQKALVALCAVRASRGERTVAGPVTDLPVSVLFNSAQLVRVNSIIFVFVTPRWRLMRRAGNLAIKSTGTKVSWDGRLTSEARRRAQRRN